MNVHTRAFVMCKTSDDCFFFVHEPCAFVMREARNYRLHFIELEPMRLKSNL